MIGRQISHYHILEKVGEGGMGVVYKAQDARLKRFVALKFLPRELTRDVQAVERFMQEAQTASSLDHQNICTIYEFSETEDGQLFFVMAYYDGETLRQRIDQASTSYDATIGIVRQLCDGLASAHARGIIHRDIKPANLMITRDGVLKILDFGLAKLAGQIRITKQHSTLGTVSYMSPEQLSGGTIDHRTDIWSVGVLFYEMLSGCLPFRGEIEQAVIYSILNEDPEPLSDSRKQVSKSIERIILKALEKEPADRYASLEEFVADIQSLAFPSLKVYQKHKSIVVLPFENMGPDKNDDYISDGLTEEVITDLSQLSELRVISRSSAMAFKEARKDIQKIRRQLDVQYVLEGSMRKSGDQIRITAQLIDARNDSHLWAEKYTGTLDDIFQIQEKVASAIVDSLKIKLAPDEEKRLTEHGITNVQAYECYLRARHFLWYFRKDFLHRAKDELERGLKLTGPNELLYATLGWIYHLFLEIGIPGEGTVSYMQKANECVDKVFELEPDSADGYGLAGILCYRRGDFQSAVNFYKKCLAVNPQNPDVLQSFVYAGMLAGHGDAVLPWIEILEKVDPMTPISACMRGFYFGMQGRFSEALPFYDKMYKMSSENPAVRFFYAWVLSWNDQYETALQVLEQIIADAAESIFAPLAQIMKHALRDEKEKALHFCTPELLGAAEHVECFSRFLMEFFAYMGEKEKAIDWVEKTIQRGFINYPYLATHARFLKSIRSEPRFQRIIKDVKTKWESFTI